MENVIIIGAGLSGLSTAYHLKKKNIGFKVMEAQNRLGGRIQTIYGDNETPMEMGATWFSKEHKNLLAFLSEINVGYFEQHTEGIALFETMSFEPPQKYFVPANSHSAYRVQGGTSSIIEALHQSIGNDNIILNTEIIKIIDEGDILKLVDSLQNEFFCKCLIIAIPPRLISSKIDFVPEFPNGVTQVMQKTQTWMSGSTKFSVEYKTPFWKENSFSGSVYSQSGLATEIYDHTNFEETKFGLLGFLNGSASQYTTEERKDKVIAQLKYYFGKEAQDFISYSDKIWNDKYIQAENDGFLSPHQNNGHSIYDDAYMNNKLFFTGTETIGAFGGYMEGAVISAKVIADRVTKLLGDK
jgi:monoamine oxidase